MSRYLELNCLFLMLMICGTCAQNRPPPGVNPQHYQPPPPEMAQQPQYQQGAPGVPPQQFQQQPPQQYQQQPPPQQYQQQQPPQQYQQQQVPQQPVQQQQVPQQQVPQQQFQHQPQHGAGQKVLHKTDLNDERAHIKDHLEVPLDTSGMSEQELQFHYFKMHDADNNDRLDGQELIKSLFHWHDAENHDDLAKNGNQPPPPGDKIFTDAELTNMIDPILDQDDHNKDGFIDYTEFMAAQTKASAGATAK